MNIGGGIGGYFSGGLAGMSMGGPVGGALGAVGGGLLGAFGGGGGDEEQAPTLTDIFGEYPDILRILMGATNEFAPQQAELQASLQEQFMPRLLQSQQDSLEQVSPYGAGLTELLAQQATGGMSGELTDSERRQFLDMQKSLVGEQATSGIGTDYIGGNLLNYIQGRKQNAQQLGVQARSLLPALSLQQPSYTDYSQQYSPSQFLGGAQTQGQMNFNSQQPGFFQSMLPTIGQLGSSFLGGPGGAVVGNAMFGGLGNTGGNTGSFGNFMTPAQSGVNFPMAPYSYNTPYDMIGR